MKSTNTDHAQVAIAALEEAISRAGGSAALARMVAEKPSTVGMWRMRGRVPAHKAKYVRDATGVELERLIPHVFF